MFPDDAVRQLEYVINASLDESGKRAAPMYGKTFERVAENGTERDVTELAGVLGDEVRNGVRPMPAEADAAAEKILQNRRAMTDGGQ
ncbi:hypothetical protein ACNS7O_01140 [Haloferacaceae archaeon DSL9]